jgi:hypothetical protein
MFEKNSDELIPNGSEKLTNLFQLAKKVTNLFQMGVSNLFRLHKNASFDELIPIGVDEPIPIGVDELIPIDVSDLFSRPEFYCFFSLKPTSTVFPPNCRSNSRFGVKKGLWESRSMFTLVHL